MKHEWHFLLSSICCTLCFIFPFFLQCHFTAVMNISGFLYIVKLVLLAQLESDRGKYKIKTRLVCQKGGLSGVMLLSLVVCWADTVSVNCGGARDEQKKTTYCMFFLHWDYTVILVPVPKVTDLECVCGFFQWLHIAAVHVGKWNWHHLCREANDCLHS